jgi:uncharacterized protein
MVPQDDLSYALENYSGTARLFPLPGLVLFPHVMQPLHIFEPRYKELLEAAVVGDRLIAMATLQPGWEDDYEGRPAIYPVACLGRVSVHHRLPDGGYNLLLLGLRRLRVVRELPPARSYREALAEVWEDESPPQEAAARADLTKRLRAAFVRLLPSLPQAREHIDQLLGTDVSLGVLTDVIGYMVDIDLAEKEALLAENNVRRRAEWLIHRLDRLAMDGDTSEQAHAIFPPPFSPN